MPARSFIALLLLGVAATACRKKLELVPDNAKDVSRSDSTESVGDTQVKKREYKFTLAGRVYLCESRIFGSSEQATIAGRASIAERPSEQLVSEKSTFAVSGRSVWLKTGDQIVWCMLASGKADELEAAMTPLKSLFRQKFHELSK